MEYRYLEIKDLSAKDLKDVNLFSKMDVYVVAMIDGDPRTKQKTPVDKDGGTSPKWKNYAMKFAIDEAAMKANRLSLHFQLRTERSLGDRDVGEVHVPVKDLFGENNFTGQDEKAAAAAAAATGERRVSYSVRTPSGKAKGTLNFSLKFGEKITAPTVAESAAAPKKIGDEPVMAYPPNMAGASSAYATPPQGGGYYYPPPPPHGSAAAYPPHPPAGYASNGYPPAYGYGGYPPPQYGYGGYAAPPPVVQKPPKKNNKFGLGLGAGLLGGLLIGDMVSDVGDMGDYDGGFDDAGFDF